MRLARKWSAQARWSALPRSKKASPDPLSAGLRLLARRPYSVAELRRALEKKFRATAPVRAAIVRLRELGYLDDRKFAEHYASSLARNRAFGRYRVRRELKAKLVDYRHIEPAVTRAFEETDEHLLLEKTLAKRLPVSYTHLTLPTNREV